MAKEIKFNIKLAIDGKEQIVTAVTNAKALGTAFKSARQEVSGFNTSFKGFTEMAVGIRSMLDSLQSLKNFMGEFTREYATQVQNEKRLAEVMRQRMDASEEDIKQMYALAEAQKAIGVIDDDIQLAGMQQVATFLTQKSSIETLLPAMNNLIAQQKGVSATAQDAQTIGNLFGKAMQGQVTALRRVGISFNEAQAEILKTGDEEERAAMLAQIVTENVGNMNTELAKTDAGKMQRGANALNDFKENIGKALMPYRSLIGTTTRASIAFGSLITIFSGLGAATKTFVGIITGATRWVIAFGTAVFSVSTYTRIWNAVTSAAAIIQNVLRGALYGTAGAATTAAVCIRGLLIASGVGIVIAALSIALESLINHFTSASKTGKGFNATLKAINSDAKKAQEAFKAEYSRVYSELMQSFTKLQTQWKTLSDAAKPQWIKDNAEEFKKLGLNINSVSDAEDVFSKNTAKVKQAFRERAKAAAQYAKLQELYSQQMEIQNDLDAANAAANKRHKVKAGDKADLSQAQEAGVGIGMLNFLGKDNWTHTAASAAMVNNLKYVANNSQARILRAREKAVNAEIDKLVNQMALGGGETTYTPAGAKGAAKTTAAATKKEIKKPIERAQLDYQTFATQTTSSGEIKGSIPTDFASIFGGGNLGGSAAALREQGQNLQNLFDQGRIPLDILIQGVKELNEELDKIGAQRISINANPKDLKKTKSTTEDAAKAVESLGGAFTALGNATETPALNAAGTIAQAIASLALSFSQALSGAAATGPWGWIAFAATGLATLVTTIATVKNVSKYAEGGIAYGPTLGLFGEYAGASTNPEVVAPLNKLRSMIQPSGVVVGGNFVLKGRDLVAALRNEKRISRKASVSLA